MDTFFLLSMPSCGQVRMVAIESSGYEVAHQFSEKLINNALCGLVRRIAISFWSQSVQFIKEYDAWRGGLAPTYGGQEGIVVNQSETNLPHEHFAHCPLGFTHIFVE
jgi:hypothetical protein